MGSVTSETGGRSAERFAFRQTANVAQAFGHDEQAPMSPTCTLFGMTPRAMTAQFSNSNGGMTRSFSTVHGRSRTTKPRPARASGSLSGNAQTWRRRLAMTRQAVGEISMPIMVCEFSKRRWMILLPRGRLPIAGT